MTQESNWGLLIAGRFFTNWAIREALTLPPKVHIFKVMVFPVVRIWKLDHNEGWVPKNWRFELWCWRRLLRVPWIARRSNQSILKDINPEYSLEGLTLKLQYFGHLMWRTDSLEKTLMLGKAEGRRRREWQRMRWLVGIWAVSSFWLLWAMLLCLCRHTFAFLLGRYLGVEQLGGMVTLWLSFWGTARLFSKATAQLSIPTGSMRVPLSPQLYQHLLLSMFYIIAILAGMNWHLTVALICIALMVNGANHLALFISHLSIFFEEMSVHILGPFFQWGYLSFYYWVMRVLYSLDPSLLSDKLFANISSYSVGCLHQYTFFSVHIKEAIAFRHLLLVFFQP